MLPRLPAIAGSVLCMALLRASPCHAQADRSDGIPLHGIVIDSGSGQAIAGAQVFVMHPGRLSRARLARTDKNGLFRLTAPDSSVVVLRIQALGHRPRTVVLHRAELDRDIRVRMVALPDPDSQSEPASSEAAASPSGAWLSNSRMQLPERADRRRAWLMTASSVFRG